jgi:hypothetical protein
MIPRHQRRITSPLPKHHIPQRIVRHRRVVPLINHPRRPLRTSRPHRPSNTSPSRPNRPSQPSRTRHSLRTLWPHSPRTAQRQQPPLRRTQPRRVPMITRHQRNITRPRKHHHIAQAIIHRRPIRPLIVPHPTATRPRRSGRTNRTSRPRQPNRPLRPGSPGSSRQSNRSSRPLRDQRNIQLRRMPGKIILLAIKLHRSHPRRKSNPIIRRRHSNPPLHQRRHIHRHKRPRLTHLHHLRRTPQRRQAPIRNAVLPPGPTHALHTHQPTRIHPIAINPQHSPRNLRRRSPRWQHPQIKLQQRRIPAAHPQIRNRPAIHRRQRRVHMRIRHQRSLRRKPRHRPAHHRHHHHERPQPSPKPPHPSSQRSKLSNARRAHHLRLGVYNQNKIREPSRCRTSRLKIQALSLQPPYHSPQSEIMRSSSLANSRIPHNCARQKNSAPRGQSPP